MHLSMQYFYVAIIMIPTFSPIITLNIDIIRVFPISECPLPVIVYYNLESYISCTRRGESLRINLALLKVTGKLLSKRLLSLLIFTNCYQHYC